MELLDFRTVFSISLLLFLTSAAFATILHVPSEYTTIQAGIDAAVNGDTVLVADGTYSGVGNYRIDFAGKEITLTSEHGAETTVIDPQNVQIAFNFHSEETVNSIVDGFTITHSRAYVAVWCESSSPHIMNCIITQNYGDGFHFAGSNAVIEDCIITENNGAGMSSYDCDISVIRTDFLRNTGTGVAFVSLWERAEPDRNAFTDCSFIGNGRGVNFTKFSGVFTRCILSDNSNCAFAAFYGGLTIDDCIITQNTGYNGAAIFLECYSRVFLSNSTISRNSAIQDGGGIYIHSLPICNSDSSDYLRWGSISNCVFAENSAGRLGGAIYNDENGGSLSIGGSPETANYFENNTAAGGSEFFDLYSAGHNAQYNSFTRYPWSDFVVCPQSSFNLDYCTSDAQPVTDDLYVAPTGDDANDGLTPETPLRTINRALSQIKGTQENPVKIYLAEGVYSPSSNGEQFPVLLLPYVSIMGSGMDASILDSEGGEFICFANRSFPTWLQDVTLQGPEGEYLKGIYSLGSDLHIENVKIWGLSTEWLAYCVFQEGGFSTIESCIFVANSGYSSAGVWGIEWPQTIIRNSLISQIHGEEYSAGIFIQGPGLATIENSTISYITTGLGAGIFGIWGTGFTVTDCLIANNSATIGGGMLITDDSLLVMNESTVSNNTAFIGGGLYNDYSDCSVYDSFFLDNSATIRGGGLCTDYGVSSLYNCVLLDNSAVYRGGGVYNTSSDCSLFNCLLIDNSAVFRGGGVSSDGTTVTLQNCTVVNNSSGQRGGGLNGSVQARESIIRDNSPVQISPDQVVQFSNVQAGYPGIGNLDIDPLFVQGPQMYGDFYLSQIEAGQPATSPCVDAGELQVSEICYEFESMEHCLNEFTTRTDQLPDANLVDIGYHYRYIPLTFTPTSSPTETPTISPTCSPTLTTTESPTSSPTLTPTLTPTATFTASPTFSPTVTSTDTPHLTPTQTVTASYTPTAPVSVTTTPTISPTQTITPFPTTSTGTGTPTGTPSPKSSLTPTPTRESGVKLLMPDHYFRPGDDCWLRAIIDIPGTETLDGFNLFVMLEFEGDYWFYPSWQQYPPDLDFITIPHLPAGRTNLTVVPFFTWPLNVGVEDGLTFYSALFTPDNLTQIGVLGTWEFGYGE